MNLNNFSFEYPYVFLILILYFICKRYCLKRVQQSFFSNVALIQQLTNKENQIKTILEFLLLLFLLFALANPVIKERILKNNQSGYEIAITLDASESMRDDNRFTIAKQIISEFVANRGNDRLSLSLFAQNVYLAVPFTYEKKPLQDILEYIEIGVAGSIGTSLYDALYMSGNLFKDSKSKNKICILLTDGIDTKNNIALDIAIKNAQQHNLKVYVIAVGMEEEYNKKVLEKIAQETNGTFFYTNNPKDLSAIYSQIDSLEKSEIETEKYTKIKYLYQYPLILAIICIILLFVKGVDKKHYFGLIVLSIIIALYKPTLQIGDNNTHPSYKFLIALDVSKSMLATDIKPDRLSFGKEKVKTLLQNLKEEKISLFGFSNQIYLISPFTNNYAHLETFLDNLYLENINQNGTEYLKLLEYTNKFFQKNEKKPLLLITDGGEQNDFTKEIAFAKQHDIVVFVYLIGSNSGSAITINGELVRDKNNQIVLTKANETIKQLAIKTGGAIYKASVLQNDLESFISVIHEDFRVNEDYKQEGKFELFILSLFFSLILFFLWRFEVKR